RYILLSTIDERWKEHLYDLDHLKASIGFRGWGQKDPLIEYKREAYDMFVDLMTDIQSPVARLHFRARLDAAPPHPPPPTPLGPTNQPSPQEEGAPAAQDTATGPARRPAEIPGAALGVNPMTAVRAPQPQQMITNRGQDEAKRNPVAVAEEVGRNDPCPCGSG